MIKFSFLQKIRMKSYLLFVSLLVPFAIQANTMDSKSNAGELAVDTNAHMIASTSTATLTTQGNFIFNYKLK